MIEHFHLQSVFAPPYESFVDTVETLATWSPLAGPMEDRPSMRDSEVLELEDYGADKAQDDEEEVVCGLRLAYSQI